MAQILQWFYIDINRASFGSSYTVELPKDGQVVCIADCIRPYRVALRILYEENAEMQARTFFMLETRAQHYDGSPFHLTSNMKHFATVRRNEHDTFDIIEEIK